MKRTKIMLTAIAIFAVAGGALAFKATKYGQRDYCYTTTIDALAKCPLTSTSRIFQANAPTQQYKYTTTNNVNLCNDVPTTLCTSAGRPSPAI